MKGLKYIHMTLAILWLVLTSCSTKGTDVDDTAQIRFSTEIIDATKAAPDDQIAPDEFVGIFINEDSTTPVYTYNQNAEYKAGSDGSLTPSGQIQYFPQNGKGITISAYHPFTAAGTAAFDFSIAADQSLNENYYASDLLHFPKTSFSKSSTAINLEFKHKLSKITYSLTAGVGAPDLTGAEVRFLNVNPSVNFDPVTGTLTALTSAPVSITPNPNFGTIIVPQTIPASTRFISVKTAEMTYYFTPTGSGYIFNEGKSYNFFITVNKTGITVQVGEITTWGDGSTEVGSTHVYSVGDYYPDPENATTAVGVIFQTFDDGLHGKILCKDRKTIVNLTDRWAVPPSDNFVTGAFDPDNGMINRNTIVTIPDWNNNFPIFAYWLNYGTEWYIPSKNEMMAICAGYCGLNYGEDISAWPDGTIMPNYATPSCVAARAFFDAKIAGLGNADMMLGAIYLSSTEYSATDVYAFQFSHGESSIQNKSKGIPAYATRPIRSF